MALSVKQRLGLDKVFLVPNLTPPHRSSGGQHPEDRLEMINRSIKNYRDDLECDDREIRRGGISYAVDTLKELNQKYKAENIYFIMGADAFLDFPHWKDFPKLLELSNFVVTTRPGTEFSLDAVDLPAGLENFVKATDANKAILSTGRSITLVQLEDIDISSTEIRKLLRNNHNAQKFLVPSVLEYINEKGLYKRKSPLVEDYREFSFFCSRSALDKKALALKIYDMTRKNAYADYSIICSATSTKHATSIADGIIKTVKDEFGLTPISIEGMREGHWVLIDFGAVVVHVFQDTVRGQYNIEGLWQEDCQQIQHELKVGSPHDKGNSMRV
jgi:nicotinate-nucleotide adenylyltransferase